MTKQETYDYLRAHGVDFEITEHKAVFNMEECADLHLPYPESEAKNLFIRDDKHAHYYLITVKGRQAGESEGLPPRPRGTRPLTFASPEELLDLLKLTPGSVTPLGLLADEEHRVDFFLDRDFLLPPDRIGVHPNDNTATIWLSAQALVNVLKENGTTVEITEC